MDVNTKVLSYIVSISETGSMTQTARKYFISQPALSKHLANTEANLGYRLFYRDNGRLLLTDAGKIYINEAKAILYTESQLQQELEQFRHPVPQSLLLSFDPALRSLVLSVIYPSFRKAFPSCTIHLKESGVVQERGISLISTEASSSKSENTLSDDELVFVTRRSFMHSDSEQLCQGIRWRDPSSYWQTVCLSEEVSTSYQTNAIIETSSLDAAMELILYQNARAILPASYARHYSHELSLIPLNHPIPFTWTMSWGEIVSLKDETDYMKKMIKDTFNKDIHL